MANRQFEDRWDLLKQVSSTDAQKDAIRKRLQASIQSRPAKNYPTKLHYWKGVIAAALLIIIFGGLMLSFIEELPTQKQFGQYTIEGDFFNWELDDVTSKKSNEGLELYHKNDSIPFGNVREVSEEEKNNIVYSKPMHVNEELENFPYQMSMFIEHVKREVAIRYYFFIPMEKEKWLMYTFDYPHIEYADIFRAMSTLEIAGKKPYRHSGPLFITHGYDRQLYPVDLKPISVTVEHELYYWEGASDLAYRQLIRKMEDDKIYWRKDSEDRLSTTFVSTNEIVTVRISLNGNELTYDYVYNHQEE